MSTVETVREIIRAEVARARPVADSRRAIELIAESSVRFTAVEDGPKIEVLGSKGEPRRTEAGAPFTLRDLLAEIRAAHPSLFEGGEASPDSPTPPLIAAPEKAAPAMPPASLPRDWLLVREGEAAPPYVRVAAPEVAPASSLPPASGIVESPPRPDVSPVDAIPRAPRAGAMVAAGRPSVPRGMIAASAMAVTILTGGAIGYWLTRPPSSADAAIPVASVQPPVAAAPAAPARPLDPPATGSVKAPSADEGMVRGVPEVIDTATLSVGGKVLPLFGVEWVRGAGDPADLTNYLRKREVSCRPAANEASSFRCEIEGHDLSKVVLYNGGGRATASATPDLQAAEAHAKAARIGLWGR